MNRRKPRGVAIDTDYPSEEAMNVIRKVPVPPLRKLSTKKLFDPENLDVNLLTDAELRQAAKSGRVPKVSPGDEDS